MKWTGDCPFHSLWYNKTGMAALEASAGFDCFQGSPDSISQPDFISAF